MVKIVRYRQLDRVVFCNFGDRDVQVYKELSVSLFNRLLASGRCTESSNLSRSTFRLHSDETMLARVAPVKLAEQEVLSTFSQYKARTERFGRFAVCWISLDVATY